MLDMSHHVNAELVANVLKVAVKAGDTVAPGDTLVLLESMKMEIPVTTEVRRPDPRGRRLRGRRGHRRRPDRRHRRGLTLRSAMS